MRIMDRPGLLFSLDVLAFCIAFISYIKLEPGEIRGMVSGLAIWCALALYFVTTFSIAKLEKKADDALGDRGE